MSKAGVLLRYDDQPTPAQRVALEYVMKQGPTYRRGVRAYVRRDVWERLHANPEERKKVLEHYFNLLGPQTPPVWRTDFDGAQRLESRGLILRVKHVYGERWLWDVYHAATRKSCGSLTGPEGEANAKDRALAAVSGVLEGMHE